MTIELTDIDSENEGIKESAYASFTFDWHFQEIKRLDPHDIITNGTNRLTPSNFKLDEE